MSQKLDLYVTLSTFAEVDREPLRVLEASGLRFGVNQTGKRPTAWEVMESSQGAKALVAGVEQYDATTLAQFHQRGLRCISRCGVGTENIDRHAAASLGIVILNTPDEPVQAVAEHALCLMLALLRRLLDLDRDTKAGKWKRHTGNLLQGKIVGLIGYGRIGKRTGELARAFGASLLVLDPQFIPTEGIEQAMDLKSLLERADIVSLHCPPGTVRLGATELDSMVEGAWLINTARGGLVDEEALGKALDRNHLAGAALDVFSQEPYTGPLLKNQRVILTPHQATLTKETRLAMEIAATQNAIEFVRKNK
jgi:D-3-phosphoglycerate dehydrogenase